MENQEPLTTKNPKLLSMEQMAECLGVPLSWLYARSRIKNSDFPALRVGKYIKFLSVESVLDWISKQNEGRQ